MRRAGEWINSCLAGVFILGYVGLILLGLVMWVVDLVSGDDAPSSPSSTLSAVAPTTVSTVAPTWTTAPPSSATQPSRTLRTVPPTDYARHYRIGARCRDGWRSDATGRGACSWHGGVAEWLYADDRIIHETKTGREIGTVKWVGAFVGRHLQLQAKGGLLLDEAAVACDRTFTDWKRRRLTDMRERDRDQFVSSCQWGRASSLSRLRDRVVEWRTSPFR